MCKYALGVHVDMYVDMCISLSGIIVYIILIWPVEILIYIAILMLTKNIVKGSIQLLLALLPFPGSWFRFLGDTSVNVMAYCCV